MTCSICSAHLASLFIIVRQADNAHKAAACLGCIERLTAMAHRYDPPLLISEVSQQDFNELPDPNWHEPI